MGSDQNQGIGQKHGRQAKVKTIRNQGNLVRVSFAAVAEVYIVGRLNTAPVTPMTSTLA